MEVSAVLDLRPLALSVALLSVVGLHHVAQAQYLAQPLAYNMMQEANPDELGPSDEGDDLSATLSESEEEGFVTEPVGPPQPAKPPVNPCTTSHKSVFYDNDFSYLEDPDYHGHCLGDCWKLMPVGNCGQYGTLDVGGQTRLRYHHEVGMGQDVSGPGVLRFWVTV